MDLTPTYNTQSVRSSKSSSKLDFDRRWISTFRSDPSTVLYLYLLRELDRDSSNKSEQHLLRLDFCPCTIHLRYLCLTKEPFIIYTSEYSGLPCGHPDYSEVLRTCSCTASRRRILTCANLDLFLYNYVLTQAVPLLFCPTLRVFATLPRNCSFRTSSFQPTTITSTIYKPATRSFHASPATMTIKTYFDCTWQGPVLDANMQPTDKIQGKTLMPSFPITISVECHHHTIPHQCQDKVRSG